jgi:hypothetical protein
MSRDLASVNEGTSILRSAIRFKWKVEDKQSFIQKQFISVSTHNGGEFNHSSVMVSFFYVIYCFNACLLYNVNIIIYPNKNSLKIVKLFFTKRQNSEICIHVQLEHQTSNILFIYESLKGEFSQKSRYDCHKCNFMLFIVIQIKKNAILILFNYLIISYFEIKLYTCIYIFKCIPCYAKTSFIVNIHFNKS